MSNIILYRLFFIIFFTATSMLNGMLSRFSDALRPSNIINKLDTGFKNYRVTGDYTKSPEQLMTEDNEQMRLIIQQTFSFLLQVGHENFLDNTWDLVWGTQTPANTIVTIAEAINKAIALRKGPSVLHKEGILIYKYARLFYLMYAFNWVSSTTFDFKNENHLFNKVKVLAWIFIMVQDYYCFTVAKNYKEIFDLIDVIIHNKPKRFSTNEYLYLTKTLIFLLRNQLNKINEVITLTALVTQDNFEDEDEDEDGIEEAPYKTLKETIKERLRLCEEWRTNYFPQIPTLFHVLDPAVVKHAECQAFITTSLALD